MGKGVWVYAEYKNGDMRHVTYEGLGAARKIADEFGEELAAVIIGKNVEALGATLGQYGADKVFVIENNLLEHYTPEGYSKVFADLIKEKEPNIIIFGATAQGKDLSAKVAAKIDAGLATDCTELKIEDGKFVVRRPMYAGKVYADVGFDDDAIKMASIRPNVMQAAEKDESKQAEIEKIAANINEEDIKAKFKEFVEVGGGKIDLTEALIIVSGGRGMKNAENFAILEELADVIGGVVGASRAAVDAGWRPQSDQVGQSGKVVTPNLYIACGISGAIQHLAGMGTSKVIVAINKDPDAPIFNKADYGVVADLFKVVPALTKEFKKILSK